MLKKLMALCLSLFSLVFLVACAGEGVKKTEEPQGGGEIVVQTAWGKSNVTKLNQLTEEFTKQTGIKVKYEESKGWKEIKGNVEKALSAQAYPHMVFAYNDHIASYNRKRQNVVNLKSFIENDNEFKEVYEKQINANFKKETTYFEPINKNLQGIFNLPLLKSTEAIYYNKDLLAEFGYKEDSAIKEKFSTWKGVHEFCEEVVNHKLFKEKELSAVYGYDSDANYFITEYEQNGFEYTKYIEEGADKGKGKVVFKHGEAALESAEVKRLAELRAMFEKRYFVTYATNGGDYASNLFKVKKTLFNIASTGGVQHNVSFDENHKSNFNIGVAPLPQHDEFKGRAIQQGPNIAMLDKGATENAKTWKLMKFLLSEKVQLALSLHTGYSSVLENVLSSKDYSDAIAELKKADVSTEDGIKSNVLAQVFELYKTESSKYFTSPAFAQSTVAREQIQLAFPKILNSDKLEYKQKNAEGIEEDVVVEKADITPEHIKRYIAYVLEFHYNEIDVA